MNALTLDRIDVKILNELQHDASLTNVELATRVNLSPSPCLTRVRTLERIGVIDRRVTLINQHVVGLGITAFIQIRLEKQVLSTLDNFYQKIAPIGEIMECYLMVGDNDYLLRAVVRNLEDLEHLIVNKLSKIEGIANIRSSLTLKQIQYKTALPIDTERPVQVVTNGRCRR